MEEPNILNIPAFKRKRSISARARKKPDYSMQKPRTPKKHKTTRATTKRRTKITEDPFMDIPIRENLPSEDLFPNPMELEDEPAKGNFREMLRCGICEGYFDNIEVAVIKLTSPLRQGDRIIFETSEGLFEQEVTSMQINRKDITLARTGSDIGMKVLMKPQVGTPVYKVI